HHVIRGLAIPAGIRGWRRLAARRRPGLLVQTLGHAVAQLGEPLYGGLQRVGIFAFERLPRLGDRALDVAGLALADLVLVVGEQLLDAVGEGVGLVAQIDHLALALVLVGVRLGVLDHLLDLALLETRRRGDGDGLRLARR